MNIPILYLLVYFTYCYCHFEPLHRHQWYIAIAACILWYLHHKHTFGMSTNLGLAISNLGTHFSMLTYVCPVDPSPTSSSSPKSAHIVSGCCPYVQKWMNLASPRLVPLYVRTSTNSSASVVAACVRRIAPASSRVFGQNSSNCLLNYP